MRMIDADALIEFCAERWIPLNIDAVNMQPTIQPEKAQLSKEGTTSDLISRQEAIDAVNNAFDRETLLTVFVRSIALRAIRDMPSVQPEPQWIPVSERLPEESGYYITSNEYNGVGEDFYYDGHFWNADKNAYEVIAWMPLPEPYKPNK